MYFFFFQENKINISPPLQQINSNTLTHHCSKSTVIRIPTRTLAAGLSMCRDLSIVAPSFVTVTSRPLPVDCRILSYMDDLQQPDS